MAHPIRDFLETENLTVSDLARKAKVQRTSISRVLSGARSSFSLDAAARLSRVTGIPVTDLAALPEEAVERIQAEARKRRRQ